MTFIDKIALSSRNKTSFMLVVWAKRVKERSIFLDYAMLFEAIDETNVIKNGKFS